MPNLPLPHDHGQVLESMNIPNTEDFLSVSNVFKLLSDATRLRIFWILCHGEECVINLSAMMQMSPPAISHHLRQLKESRLIISHRKGKEVYYTAAKTPICENLHLSIEKIMEITCPQPE